MHKHNFRVAETRIGQGENSGTTYLCKCGEERVIPYLPPMPPYTGKIHYCKYCGEIMIEQDEGDVCEFCYFEGKR